MQLRALLLLIFSITLALTACSSGGDVSQDPVTVDSQGDATAPGNTDPVEEPQPDPQCQPTDEEQLMLDLVNSARAEARQCGAESYAATQALTWNCQLRDAAEAHSQDMGTNNFFSHTGSDGLNVGHRVTATGYAWRAVGENIAAGYSTEEQVMQGWLDSPGHCENIMNPVFSEFGSGVIFVDQADYNSYWTQVFATPR